MSRVDFLIKKCCVLDKENASQKQKENIKVKEKSEQLKCRIASQKLLKRPVLLIKNNDSLSSSTSNLIQPANAKNWSSQSKFQIFNEPAIKNDLLSKNTDEFEKTENIKSSKLAFQRAKSFFINKEIESSKYRTDELCGQLKNESKKIHGVLKRQVSLAPGFKFDGTLINRRIQQLKIEELRGTEETPLYFLNRNLPKLEEVNNKFKITKMI